MNADALTGDLHSRVGTGSGRLTEAASRSSQAVTDTELYAMDPNGSGMTLLTYRLGIGSPSWSPDKPHRDSSQTATETIEST